MPTQEQIHKELDLLQDAIKRMADNAFKVKGWAIGIFMAVIVLGKDALLLEKSIVGLLLSLSLLVPVFCFWYLDAFFLQKERKFRRIYEWLIQHRPTMDQYLYDLKTLDRQPEKITDPPSTLRIMFSHTLLPFYLIPVVLTAAILFYQLSC